MQLWLPHGGLGVNVACNTLGMPHYLASVFSEGSSPGGAYSAISSLGDNVIVPSYLLPPSANTGVNTGVDGTYNRFPASLVARVWLSALPATTTDLIAFSTSSNITQLSVSPTGALIFTGDTATVSTAAGVLSPGFHTIAIQLTGGSATRAVVVIVDGVQYPLGTISLYSFVIASGPRSFNAPAQTAAICTNSYAMFFGPVPPELFIDYWQLFPPIQNVAFRSSAISIPTLSNALMYGITSTGGYPRVTRA